MKVTPKQFKESITQWYYDILAKEVRYTNEQGTGEGFPAVTYDLNDPEQNKMYEAIKESKAQIDRMQESINRIKQEYKEREGEELHLFNTIKEIEESIGKHKATIIKILDEATAEESKRGGIIRDGETFYYTILWAVGEANSIVDASEYNPLEQVGFETEESQNDFKRYFIGLIRRYKAITPDTISKQTATLKRQEKAGANRAIKEFGAKVNELDTPELFMKARQNIVINTLITERPEQLQTDQQIQMAIFKDSEIASPIEAMPFYDDTKTKMFLGIMVAHLHEYGTSKDRSEGNVTLSLSEYMNYRGLSDEKTAREEATKAIFLLLNSVVTVRSRKKVNGRGKSKLTGGFTLLSRGNVENGYIMLEGLSEIFTNDVTLMDMPKAAFSINSQTYKHAFVMIWHISRMYRQNEDKPSRIDPETRRGKVSIYNLLSKINIPTRQEVDTSKGESYKRKIIDPFFNNMDALKEGGMIDDYTVIKANGKPVKNPRILNINDFYSAMLDIDYSNYPINEERVALRHKHIEEANATREQREKEKMKAPK